MAGHGRHGVPRTGAAGCGRDRLEWRGRKILVVALTAKARVYGAGFLLGGFFLSLFSKVD